MTKDKAKRPCTYIMRCADDTFYTGWTNDLENRIKSHNSGKGSKYTSARLPVEPVHVEYFETKSEAMKREAAIKKLTRAQKLALINSNVNQL